MLPENRRQQLDGIVQQMAQNGEAEADIQFVVGDFKSKYGAESTQPAPETPQYDPSTGLEVAPDTKPGFMGRIGEAATKRINAIANPKVRGRGSIGNAIPSIGELMNTAGQLGGFVGDVGMEAIKATPFLGEAVDMIGQSLPGNPVVKAGAKAFGALPEGTRTDVGDLANATMLYPGAIAGKGALKVGAEGVNIGRDVAGLALRKTPEMLERELTSVIGKGIEKAIRPTVVGKRTAPQVKAYYEKAKNAVKTIVDNKDNLSLTDIDGNAVTGLPKTIKQFSEAIDQSKKSIYQQYHAMATEAGEAGALFDADKILTKLDDVAGDLKHNPQVRQYAYDLKAEIDELHGQPPDIIEARIADLNNSLSGFYEGRVSRAKAQVDASVAHLMREELDSNIMNAVGPGYQGLKNTYGALKTLEKEVNHRAVVNARRNTKGLLDFTDIFTGGEIVGGVLTMNPTLIARGVAGKGIKEYFKFLNNPDRIVKGMFSDAESLLNRQTVQPGLRSATGRALEGYLGDMTDVLQPEAMAAGSGRLGPIPMAAGEVAPVVSGRLRGVPVGAPYGPEILRPAMDNVINAEATSTGRLGLPAPQQAGARLAIPAGQGFELRDAVQPSLTTIERRIPQPAERGRLTAIAAGSGSNAENLVTYLQRAGKVRLGPEFQDLSGDAWTRYQGIGRTKDRSREMSDVAAVSSKNGRMSMDEAADLLNQDGFISRDGKPWDSVKLFNELSEGNARKIFTPTKQDDMINRQIRRWENDYIEEGLAELEARGEIDARAARKSIPDHKERLIDEIRAEGLIDPKNEEAALKELSDFFNSITKPVKVDTADLPGLSEAETFGLTPKGQVYQGPMKANKPKPEQGRLGLPKGKGNRPF